DHATNFFDAGGDSLKLSRLSEHLNQHFNTKVRLVELFRYPTVRAMSELIDQRTAGADRSSGSQPTASNSPTAPLKATTSLPD
ncbi:MAG: acyl carrier protein, partial [Pseudomonadota bacterium]